MKAIVRSQSARGGPLDDLETTGTFKVIKRKLQEEGASLAAAGAGRLYQLEGAAYTPVT